MPMQPMSPAKIRRLMRAPAVEPARRNIRMNVAEGALLRFARLRGQETGRAFAAILLRREGRAR